MSIAGKNIWFCVLNWGLGHASRSIPIIKSLVDSGANVSLASNGDALELLIKEFPQLKSYALPGYKVSYSKRSALYGVLRQLPQIYRAIKEEQRAMEKLLAEHPCDLIISDNRYGCHVNGTPSALITHQLRLPINGFQYFSGRILEYWFQSFSEIWVPDWDDKRSLAGQISKRMNGKFVVRHLGILSRLEKRELPITYAIVAVLSGPEPQRSQLEEIIFEQLEVWNGPTLLIRGTKSKRSQKLMQAHSNIELVDLANGDYIEKVVQQAELVVCRSGYSTLMDLCQLQKAALLVPTPGQPEQEELAEQFKSKNWCMVQDQGLVNLQEAYDQRKSFKVPHTSEMNIELWMTASAELINH